MGKTKVEEISRMIEDLDYTDKYDLFEKNFSLDIVGEDLNDKLVLISLVALTYTKMKEQSKVLITPLDILCKITGQVRDNSFFFKFLENLAIHVESFNIGVKKIDRCGLNTSTEIIDKIKELIGKWMPF